MRYGFIFMALLVASGCPSIPVDPPTDRPVSTEVPPDHPAVQRALEYLTEYGEKAGIDSVREEFQARRVIVDPDGRELVHFQRSLQGLRVVGGDVIVHGDLAGFQGFTIASDQTLDVPLTPQLDASSARTVATSAVSLEGEQSEVPELVIDMLERTPVLSWEVRVVGETEGRPSIMHVLVDATTGAVRNQWDDVKTQGVAADGLGHSLYYADVDLRTTFVDDHYELASPDGGVQVEDVQGARDELFWDPVKEEWVWQIIRGDVFRDDDNEWGDGTANLATLAGRQTAAVDIFYGVEQTRRYFSEVHGRDGWEDSGKPIYVRAHYGRRYANAFFAPGTQLLSFGDGDGAGWGPLVSLGVVGHEWAHGLTERTAGLLYMEEPGGLNEATSDIFGALVEYHADDPSDPGDWYVGEVDRLDGRVLRNMAWPRDPLAVERGFDCHSEFNFPRDPHYMSGPANRFFVMLAEGSDFMPPVDPAGDCLDAPEVPGVTGIGRDAAGAIWYRALTRHMTIFSRYEDARIATLKAAADLADAGEVPAHARRDVFQAWRAVNVRANYLLGDSNADGKVDISDSIRTLNWLFAGTADEPSCLQAADFNSDGTVDLTDAIATLQFLFQNGDGPEDPTACKTEPARALTPLSCNDYEPEVDVCATSENGLVLDAVTPDQLEQLRAAGGDSMVDMICSGVNAPAACP